MDSSGEMAYSDENASIEDEPSESSDSMDLNNYWPTIDSCVQYTTALVNIQRAKRIESCLVDIIGIFLALFRRDTIYYVEFEGEVKQFSSVQGHSGISKNWTVQLGWQLPFAGVGSMLLNLEDKFEETSLRTPLGTMQLEWTLSAGIQFSQISLRRRRRI